MSCTVERPARRVSKERVEGFIQRTQTGAVQRTANIEKVRYLMGGRCYLVIKPMSKIA